MSDSRHGYVEFKIEGGDNGTDVPVTILTQALLGFQQLVYLFALQAEGKTIRQRARLTEEIKQKYVLRCSAPKPGSVIVPAHVGDPRKDFFASEQMASVMTPLLAFSCAAAGGNGAEAGRLAPDTRLRFKMVSCLRSMTPPAGSGYRMSFRNCQGDPILLNEDVPARLEALLIERPEEAETTQTVTGLLDEINFTEHKLSIIYAPRRRVLECFYPEDMEPMLFENRRDLIQVTGRVIMDSENHPSKIVDVDGIQDLDLSPFILTEVSAVRLKLRFKKPLELTPVLSESEQIIQLTNDDLGIDVFAPSRVVLHSELKDQIIMLWQEYAREDDANLAASAKGLKDALLAAIEEVPNA